MILYILVGKLPGEPAWTLDAVDEQTIADNDDVTADMEKKARRDAGKDVVLRWIAVEVADNALELPFLPPKVKGKVKR